MALAKSIRQCLSNERLLNAVLFATKTYMYFSRWLT